VTLESIGVPAAGSWRVTIPAPCSLAVMPSLASVRSASRALMPVRSGTAGDDPPVVAVIVTTGGASIGTDVGSSGTSARRASRRGGGALSVGGTPA
jgi:hypothetical protein